MNNNNEIRNGIYPFSQDYRDYSLVKPKGGSSSQPSKSGNTFADNFRNAFKLALTSFGSTTGGASNKREPYDQYKNTSLSRDDAKAKLIEGIKAWRDESPETAKETIFNNASDKDISSILDEWAKNKTKEYLADEYSIYSDEEIADFETRKLNDLVNSIKGKDFFNGEGDEYKEEFNRLFENSHPGVSKGNVPAKRDTKKTIDTMIKRGMYTTRNAAFYGMNDYINNTRGASAPAEAEDEVVEITFNPGDTLGQKILDSGLATANGLWGADGDVNYYANQLQLSNPDTINAGSTYRLIKRK